METVAIPANEAQRLAALKRLRIVNTPLEERFERITRLTAAHFNVAIAAINLIDADCQWTKAGVGIATITLPRAHSFCAHAILSDTVLVIPDATVDERFCNNPFVIGPSPIRFYAGVPLYSSDGYALGALCIADPMPRTLTSVDIKHLQDFALLAERELTTDDLHLTLMRHQKANDAPLMGHRQPAKILDSLAEGIVLQDANGYIYACNASAERILGLSVDQMMGRSSVDPRWRTIHEDGSDFPGATHPAMVALRTGQAQENVVMGVYKPDDTLTWIVVNVHPLYHPNATVPYSTFCSFIDITEYKEYERHLKATQRELQLHNATLNVLATTDPLTGIANKRTLLERLASDIPVAYHNHLPLTLVLLDVDHFKAYNDAFGHLAGDVVLKQVATLLSTHIRSTDMVARYGGEEFVIILSKTTLEQAYCFVERLRGILAQASFPHRSITASFGLASVQDDPLSADELIERADTALYEAKRQGRNTVCFRI